MTSQLDDNEKMMALGRLQIILQNDFNSILTIDAETAEPFLIVESWEELGKIQQELNRWLRPKEYYKNCIDYYNVQGNEAFQRMRFEVGYQYLVPEGLFELDDVCKWGFSDEYITCSNCYRAIGTTPGYYGDKPRYATVNNDILCGDCITTQYEEEYIESATNKPTNAINTSIISEDGLAELGWKKLSKVYNAGIREGNNDDPKKIFNKYKSKFDEILFTYESGQFDLDFWMWIRKPSPAGEGL